MFRTLFAVFLLTLPALPAVAQNIDRPPLSGPF